MTSVQTPHHIKISSVYNGDTTSTETDYIASSIKALRNVYNTTGHHAKDTQVGSPSRPVYVKSNGDLTECDINIDNNAKTSIDSIYAEQLKNSRSIEGINFNGTTDTSHFAICTTDSNSIVKQITLENYKLTTGSRIFVRFINDNIINNPKLEIFTKVNDISNTTGSKFITVGGEKIISNKLVKDKIYELLYDGTNYEIVTFTQNRKVYKNTKYEKLSEDYDITNFYSVPKYVVGTNNVQIFKNGSYLPKDVDYKEVGIVGSVSSQIEFLTAVNKNDELSIISTYSQDEGNVNLNNTTITIPVNTTSSSEENYHWYKIAESTTTSIFNSYGIFSIISSISDDENNTLSNVQYSEITAGISNNGASILLNYTNNEEPVLKSRLKYSYTTNTGYIEIYIQDNKESNTNISMKDNYGWILYEEAVLSNDDLTDEEITNKFSYSNIILMKKNVVSTSFFSLLPYISIKDITNSETLKNNEYYINHLINVISSSNCTVTLPPIIEENAWFIVKNSGSKNVTLTATGVTIDNNASVNYILRPSAYMFVVYKGGNYIVVDKHLGIFEETKSTPLTANSEISTNNYTVGLSEINVYVDGIKTKRDVAFSEVGTVGKISNKIKILTDIPKDVDFEIIINN